MAAVPAGRMRRDGALGSKSRSQIFSFRAIASAGACAGRGAGRLKVRQQDAADVARRTAYDDTCADRQKQRQLAGPADDSEALQAPGPVNISRNLNEADGQDERQGI